MSKLEGAGEPQEIRYRWEIRGAAAMAATSSGRRGRPKEDRELKKRISLSVLPSVYEDIQKIAYVQRRSVSELIGELLEGYRVEHKAEIQRYGEIEKHCV